MKNRYLSTLAAFAFFLSVSPVVARQTVSLSPKDLPVRAAALRSTSSSDSLFTLAGIVLDASTGQPLTGARVTAQGEPRYAAMTDEQGRYSLQLPLHVTLLAFSAPGYNLTLQSAASLQSGVPSVSTRLWPSSFAADYTSDIPVTNSRSSSDFSLSSAVSVDADIASSLGADVRAVLRSGTPGMGAAMFIDGINSLHANAMPLIVVDGVYYDQQYDRTALHDGFFNNLLAGISVQDIERVTVLKNATALYGVKGSNGVILIDTKRSTSMATRIEVNAMAGIEQTPSMLSMMGADDFRLYASELIGGTDTRLTSFKFLKDDPSYYFYNKYHNSTSWADYVYREALTQNYSISVQGGDEAADYNLSLGYVDAQSTLDCNDFSRLNLRFNTDIRLLPRLSTRFDVSYHSIMRDLRDDGAPEDFTSSTILAPGFLAAIKSPFLSPYRYDESGHLTTFVEEADDFAEGLALNSSWANPVAINTYGEARNKNAFESSFFNIAIVPRWDITSRLSATTLFSYSLSNLGERSFVPMTGVPVFYIDGVGESSNRAANYTAKQESLFSDTRLSWSLPLDAHSLLLMGGFRYTDDGFQSSRQEGHNTGNDKTPNLSSSLAFKEVGGEDDAWQSMAWYGQADYSYLSRYFLQGGLALESTSRVGSQVHEGLRMAGAQWGVFPSLQGAWLLSSEPFFASRVKAVNYLKLNVGYDVSGNDDIDVNAARTSFASSKYLGNAIGLSLSAIGNTSIQWETTRRFSAGLTAAAFADRLTLSLSGYKSFTSNLLTLKSLPEISGEGYYWSNGGSLENLGGDARLDIKLLATRDWSWQVGASIGAYRNVITALPDGDFTTSAYGGEILTAVGRPAGVFYGYQTQGVFASTAQADEAALYRTLSTGAQEYFGAGDVIFVDQDGNHAINEQDKVVIGDPTPDFYGNLFSSLSWRQLSLDASFGYSVGNDVYNYLRSHLESGSTFFNQTTTLNRRWIGEGQQTDVPRASFGDPMGNARFSDRWIEDGSYLRLRQLTLSYRMPVNSIWLQGVTVWLTGNNLMTLTRYLGTNPETSVSNSVLLQGIDAGLLTPGRSLLLGVKLNL